MRKVTTVRIPKHSFNRRLLSSGAQALENQAPETCPKSVAYWLLGMSGLVATMVTIGGVTRLTRSGLSMTDWRLQGSLPPMNLAEWQKEFDRYKQFPEWQQRQKMTLDEFKFIFFWEYGHRMFGRLIGVAFVVPCSYFLARRMIPRSMYPRLALLFGLGGGQGLVGWWMVKSGLEGAELDERKRLQKEIRVSPYRLTTHLAVAFTTYTSLLWTAFGILNPAHTARSVAASLSTDCLQYARRLRGMAGVTGALVATTVVSGAFVAGNDAGRAYNTFPLMQDRWVPPSEDLFELTPTWRNFFETTALVQFDHRVLAMSTLAAIAGTVGYARMGPGSKHWKRLPIYTRGAAYSVVAMGVGQVALGISTLLLYVPVPLAAAHQAGSMVLLTLVTGLAHSLSFSKYSPSATVTKAIRTTTINGGKGAGTGTTPTQVSGASGGASGLFNPGFAGSVTASYVRPFATPLTASATPVLPTTAAPGRMQQKLYHSHTVGAVTREGIRFGKQVPKNIMSDTAIDRYKR